MRKLGLFLVLFLFTVIACEAAPTASSEVSTAARSQQLLEKEKKLEKKVEKSKAAPQIIDEEKEAAKAAAVAPGQKVLIKKIDVVGALILPEAQVKKITSRFENKELTLKEMQKVADLITDAYRKKGYVTSRAYLPLQKIQQGLLEIRVLESITGDVVVKGNHYYKTKLLKRQISLKKGEVFDYNLLKRDMTDINEHPDRVVKAVLAPGKEAGATDIVLNVKDKLPMHVGLGYDNFASRYVNSNRYTTTLTHNNFVGWDDMLTFQYQIGDAQDYTMWNLRYLVPLTNTLDLGFFMAKSKIALGREFEDLHSRGKSRLYSLFLTESVIKEGDVNLDLSLGFDYKDVYNFQLGDVTSRDRMRVIKGSFDLDIADNYGRTIVYNELGFGLPHCFGGLYDHDPTASRSGSGGEFIKDNLNILRLHRMPFGSTLLWKNQIQFSSDILTSTEQFQIGGIYNVRAYPPADYVGDRGFSSTIEWSFPPYLVPKSVKVPFSKATVYDALRVTPFFDIAQVRLKRPQPGEEKYKTLRGVGCGFRLNLPENFSVRYDIAWPVESNKPSDEKSPHAWIEVTKTF